MIGVIDEGKYDSKINYDTNHSRKFIPLKTATEW